MYPHTYLNVGMYVHMHVHPLQLIVEDVAHKITKYQQKMVYLRHVKTNSKL